VGQIVGERLEGKQSKAIQSLIEQASKIIRESKVGNLKDSLLIGAARRVEHCETTGYGTAKAFAECLGEDKIANLLGEALQEEGDADHELTEI
jgi:ferritin-like metal-binding protein YciE